MHQNEVPLVSEDVHKRALERLHRMIELNLEKAGHYAEIKNLDELAMQASSEICAVMSGVDVAKKRHARLVDKTTAAVNHEYQRLMDDLHIGEMRDRGETDKTIFSMAEMACGADSKYQTLLAETKEVYASISSHDARKAELSAKKEEYMRLSREQFAMASACLRELNALEKVAL